MCHNRRELAGLLGLWLDNCRGCGDIGGVLRCVPPRKLPGPVAIVSPKAVMVG